MLLHGHAWQCVPSGTNRIYRIFCVALIGGGQVPKPGEVSLSNHGVLFQESSQSKYKILVG